MERVVAILCPTQSSAGHLSPLHIAPFSPPQHRKERSFTTTEILRSAARVCPNPCEVAHKRYVMQLGGSAGNEEGSVASMSA